MTLQNRLALCGLVLGLAVISLTITTVSTALASIKVDLHASEMQSQWIIASYGLLMSSTILVFSRLGELFGRKKIFVIGLAAAFISMLGGGVSRDANELIFFQAILGLSAGIVTPISQILITGLFAANQRKNAIALWALVLGLTVAFGALFSGFILFWFGWRSIFLYAVPVIIVSTILVYFFLDESKNEIALEANYFGMILLMVMVSGLILAISQSGTWSTLYILILYVLSFCSSLGFIWVERRSKTPLVNKVLIQSKSFLTAAIINFCVVFFMWTCFYLMPMYLQQSHHYSVLTTGFIMLIITIPFTIISFMGYHLYRVFDAKPLIYMGFSCLLFSALIQMQFVSNTNFLLIVLSATFFGIGWGLIWEPANIVAVSALPQNQSSTSTGCLLTIRVIGGTLGVAVTISVIRGYKNLDVGYHYGMWVLIIICIMGFIATKYMPAHTLQN